MDEFVNNPPDASSLMTSARSFGNYDLAGALSDLIDNSIKAESSTIDIECLFNDGAPTVRVIDNGYGMTRDELHAAMRPASANPLEERSPDDLGRFGWGMKSASFSQCKHLSVISKKSGELSGASWDLDDLDEWKMGILTPSMIEELAAELLDRDAGTVIVWSNCDRLSENGSLSSVEFNDLIDHTADRISLTFHRFLSPEVGRQKLEIRINGTALEAFDPFYRHHLATQPLEVEPLKINDTIINIRPYILPHFSKLKEAERERLGGEDGFLRNQGFYVYRNRRLIIHGTWFRLAKYGDLSQLVRISIDIPNSMDDIWKITVDKSDAQLPALLRNRLKQIVSGLKGKSTRVIRSKGGSVDDPGKVSVWSRYSKNNEINYSINREHPLIADLLEGDKGKVAAHVLSLIEQNFPVIAFADDATTRSDGLSQKPARPEDLISQVDLVAPGVLARCNGDKKEMIRKLRVMEPFSRNWVPVEEYLEGKGWT